MRSAFIQLTYIGASVLFILGLRSLTRPDKARRGMQQAAVGMLLALCGTLMNHQIVDYKWIALGLVCGALIGYPLGMWVPTTALPQRIAASLSFGALASALVGVSEYYSVFHGGEGVITQARMAALGFEVLVGVLMVLPIGGADMPVVVALLTSYCGLGAAATGFALGNSILIIAGALDGASGFLLSMLMSKAMNRSFSNVLFGAFGGETTTAAVAGGGALPVRSISAED